MHEQEKQSRTLHALTGPHGQAVEEKAAPQVKAIVLANHSPMGAMMATDTTTGGLYYSTCMHVPTSGQGRSPSAPRHQHNVIMTILQTQPCLVEVIGRPSGGHRAVPACGKTAPTDEDDTPD